MLLIPQQQNSFLSSDSFDPSHLVVFYLFLFLFDFQANSGLSCSRFKFAAVVTLLLLPLLGKCSIYLLPIGILFFMVSFFCLLFCI